MGVGIPGTGMVGLPIAIALGAIVGKSAYGLEVLRDSTPDHVKEGQRYIDEQHISISLAEDAPSKLYVDITVFDADGREARAVIAEQHTNFILVSRGSEVLLDKSMDGGEENTEKQEEVLQLNMRKVFDYATTSPLEELEFINEAKRLNENAAVRSLEGNYGHCLGKVLSRPLGRGIMGESIFSHILSSTSCACDARMAGAMIPVMSNSGSGNQAFAPPTPWWSLPRKTTTRLRNSPAPDVEPSDGHLYQAEPRCPVGPLRMCRCRHRLELRHHLSDGRRI